ASPVAGTGRGPSTRHMAIDADTPFIELRDRDVNVTLVRSIDGAFCPWDRPVPDQFIGILSHALRTPLGAITTASALLALPEDNPERRMRVVTGIMSSAQRMERVVADLLELT